MNTRPTKTFSKILAWVPAVAIAMVLTGSAMTAYAADEAPAAPAAAPADAAAATPAADATAAAAAPADATAPAAPGAAATAGPSTVENPYGLDNLWKTGDFLSHTTVIVLAVMSMGTWYILIMRLVDQTVVLMKQATTAREELLGRR